MGRYRKILVAFDGSESSKNALRQAIMLARSEQSWIKALAVFPSYEGDIDLTGVRNIKDVMKGPAEKLISEAMDIAKEEKASVISNVEQGEVYETIVDVAESEHCDLIVLGRKGLGNLERMLMGSVTARVIGSTGRDVLVVPEGASLGWGNLLLATDGSASGDAAMERALDMAASYGSRLNAVSVVEVNEEFYALAPELAEQMGRKSAELLSSVKKRAEQAGIGLETFVREGDAHSEIVRVAGERKADAIFIGSHGKTGIKKFIIGSVAEKVIGFAKCPVFVIKS